RSGACGPWAVLQVRTAGIVVEDVELAVAGNGRLDGGLDTDALGHVAVYEMGVAATVARAFACGPSCGLPGCLVDIGDDNLGPLLGKALRRGPADATTTAGYESNFADEPPHGRPSRVRRAPAAARGTNPAPPRATPAHGQRASPSRACACRYRRREADRPLAGRPKRDRCGCRDPFARHRPDNPRTCRTQVQADMRARRR